MDNKKIWMAIVRAVLILVNATGLLHRRYWLHLYPNLAFNLLKSLTIVCAYVHMYMCVSRYIH
jgi:hypothetical protein